MKEPSLLVYDIESTPLKSWHFSLGKQVIRHGSLDRMYRKYNIICLSYMYDNEEEPTILHWGTNGESSERIIKEFDKVIKEAQDNQILIIGKNNKRFDDKHINTHQWLTGADPMPTWATYTEDLESQLRRHFYLPSFSLDAVSELRGYGGKQKMEFGDWVSNVEYKLAQVAINELGTKAAAKAYPVFVGINIDKAIEEGKVAFEKMQEYNGKDVTDTMALVKDVMPYCKFKTRKMARYKGEMRCVQANCGSTNIRRNGTRVEAGGKVQHFYCNDHNGYAGKATIKEDGTYGKMR